ncbi:MAG: hypothetical protein ABIX01_12545 [Chitinophagaceae bacterium]
MKLSVILPSILIASSLMLSCKKDIVTKEPTACCLPGQTDSITLKLGGIINLKDAGQEAVQFRFISVIDESRCPPNAVCIWGGTAAIGLQINNCADTVKLWLKLPVQVTINGNAFIAKLESLTMPYTAGNVYDFTKYEAVISLKR